MRRHPFLERTLETGKHGERSEHMREGVDHMGPVSGTVMRAISLWFGLLWFITCAICALVCFLLFKADLALVGLGLAVVFALITSIMSVFISGLGGFASAVKGTLVNVGTVFVLLWVGQHFV